VRGPSQRHLAADDAANERALVGTVGASSPRHSALRSSRVTPSTAVILPKRLTSASIRNGSGESHVATLVGEDKGQSPRCSTPYYCQDTNRYAVAASQYRRTVRTVAMMLRSPLRSDGIMACMGLYSRNTEERSRLTDEVGRRFWQSAEE